MTDRVQQLEEAIRRHRSAVRYLSGGSNFKDPVDEALWQNISQAAMLDGEKRRPLVVIESPYAGRHWFAPVRWWRQWRNVVFARECCLDSFFRGEDPFASHLLYPQILDDSDGGERYVGMQAGFGWGRNATAVAVYTDRGVSEGMLAGIKTYRKMGIPVVLRSFDGSHEDLELKLQ